MSFKKCFICAKKDNLRQGTDVSKRVFQNPFVFFLASFLIILSAIICARADVLDLIGDQEIKLYMGDTKVFTAYKPSRITIANPGVVDVASATENAITLVTKAAGVTSFVFSDTIGEHSYKIRVLAEDLTEAKKQIDELLRELKFPGVCTKINEQEGKILLLGEVEKLEDKEQIVLALGSLGAKAIDVTNVKQAKEEGIVEIEVQVLELDKDASRLLGFSWPNNITLTEIGSPALSSQGAATVSTESSGGTSSSATVTPGGARWDNLFNISRITREAFSVRLDALVQEGKARILSQPKLACLSGKEAELLVGGEKPVFTTTAGAVGGSGTSVTYKEYGIKLKIKPTIVNDDRVNVALNIEVSEVQQAETIGNPNSPTAKAYPLTKRNVATELYLKDGQTLSIGGLTKRKTEEDVIKTPGLGDVPILGLFFRKKAVLEGGGGGERGNVELYVTLTPKIVANKKPEQKEAISESGFPIQEVSSNAMFSSAEEDASSPLNDYIRQVMTKIINSTYYPEQTGKIKVEGTVVLNVILDAAGRLKDIKISKSSGYEILDKAALDAVSKQSPFMPFPPQLRLRELQVEVPITYRQGNN